MTTIKGLIFDKDGTLFDFQRSWEAWAVAVLNRLSESDKDHALLSCVIGFDAVQMRFDPDSLVIAGTPDEVANVLVPHMPGWKPAEIIALLNEEAEKADQVQAVDLQPLFSQLKARGITLGVVTNDAEAPAIAHLQSAGVIEYFDFIAGSDSGYGAKPEPGQLLAFLDHTGLEAPECVMVGDSTHDLIAGRRAQTGCIGVLTGIATRESLLPYADAVLPDIGHLPEWLASTSPGTAR